MIDPREIEEATRFALVLAVVVVCVLLVIAGVIGFAVGKLAT